MLRRLLSSAEDPTDKGTDLINQSINSSFQNKPMYKIEQERQRRLLSDMHGAELYNS